MTFNQIIDLYFSELKKEISVGTISGEATTELSYRTSMDNFFKNVASINDKEISTILEPKNQGKLGRPDWRFHNSESMGVYGYIEAKGLDQNSEINTKIYETQVKRYLVLGNPVILTDGIDFVLFTPEGESKLFSICKKPINWQNPEINLEIEILFKMFFKKVGYRKLSENQLVNEVAKRAKLLTSELIELLELDEDEAENNAERITIHLLNELKNTAEHSHDSSLIDNNNFAGFISQILTFGLLYAHRAVDNSSISPKDKYFKIHDFWFSYLEEDYSNKLIPFKTLVKELKTELDSDLSRLGIWYDDLRRLLAHIQLSNEQIEIPDFHELYETFLEVYDAKTRFDYGAFYTPRSLAFYTVNLVKVIIENSLPNLIVDSAKYKIIDPCCGTGTFIEAMIEKFQHNAGFEIIGFEILPAPYALAHYRMAMLSEHYPANIKIVLTNTLSDNLFEERKINKSDNNISILLIQEQQAAYQLSTPPLTIIIGNPPSSDSKFQFANEGEIIKDLLEDFKPTIRERTGRQNTQKQLKNEFIKFLRWTIDRAKRSIPSVFALIMPSSFAKHPSYKYARKYLVENISELWVLEFDSDNRAGMEGSNIFNTLQGRLILVGVLKDKTNNNFKINYKNICNLSKQEKINFFNLQDSISEWLSIDKMDGSYTFKPTTDYNATMYKRFWPLTSKNGDGIFLRHCSSLKLAPTHLLVHASEGQLKRRSKFISKTENDFATIKERWYSGQQKPPPATKINDNIKVLLEKAVRNQNIFKYSYRPFIETFVLLDNELLYELGNMEGGGTRDRPEVRAAYSNENVFGFVVAPAPEDLSKNLHKFSSFCWNVPDNDLSTRGNAHIFCNYFPEYKKKKDWDSKIKTNINPVVINLLNSFFKIDEKEIINSITFYSYAVLSSDFYLEKFKGKLFNVAGEYPSIPITSNKELFLQICEIGKKLAEFEADNFRLDSQQIDLTELEYHKYIIESDTIRLLDEKGNLVFQLFNIDKNVLSFEISGYRIIKEWLKLHSFPYYRKKLEAHELNELSTLLAKVKLYLCAIKDLDEKIKLIFEDKLFEK